MKFDSSEATQVLVRIAGSASAILVLALVAVGQSPKNDKTSRPEILNVRRWPAPLRIQAM